MGASGRILGHKVYDVLLPVLLAECSLPGVSVSPSVLRTPTRSPFPLEVLKATSEAPAPGSPQTCQAGRPLCQQLPETSLQPRLGDMLVQFQGGLWLWRALGRVF